MDAGLLTDAVNNAFPGLAAPQSQARLLQATVTHDASSVVATADAMDATAPGARNLVAAPLVWSFRIADTTGPTLTTVLPPVGNTDVPVSHRDLVRARGNAAVAVRVRLTIAVLLSLQVLTFSEPVLRGTGSIEVFETGQGQPAQSASVSGWRVSIDDNVVSVRLSGGTIALEFTECVRVRGCTKRTALALATHHR